MSWADHSLDELGFLSRGKSKHRPRNDPILYGGQYPFIQTADVKHAQMYVASHRQTYNDRGLEQSKLWPKDTLCITIAANIADTALLGYEACFPDSIIGFIADPDKCDVRYIKYYFDVMQAHYKQISQGAAQDNLSQRKLLSLEIPTPPVPAQRKIADYLTAYNDLIANNERRIELLEEAMHLLYREWFVHLRFPGWEETEIVDGVPEGWEKRPLGDESVTILINRGYQPKYLEESDCRVINQRCIRNHKINFDLTRGNDEDRRPITNTKRFVRFGDVLVNSTGIGTLGRVAQVYRNLRKHTVDSHVTIVRPNPTINIDYFGNTMWEMERAIEHLGEGATGQTELSRHRLAQLELLIPSPEVQIKFAEFAHPARKQIVTLLDQNQLLRDARDALLPRLMSGRIEV